MLKRGTKPMNQIPIIVFDLETGGTIKGQALSTELCLPLQLAAQAIDPRKFTPLGSFASYISPGCKYEELEPEALAINKITKAQLEDAPDLSTVFRQFVNFVNQFNRKPGSIWDAPIPGGHNIVNFDLPIINRLCVAQGFVDKNTKKPNIFNARNKIDTIDMLFGWFENQVEPSKFNFDYLREFFGMSKVGAHNAVVDVQQESEVIIRFLKFHRNIMQKLQPQFKGAFASK